MCTAAHRSIRACASYISNGRPIQYELLLFINMKHKKTPKHNQWKGGEKYSENLMCADPCFHIETT